MIMCQWDLKQAHIGTGLAQRTQDAAAGKSTAAKALPAVEEQAIAHSNSSNGRSSTSSRSQSASSAFNPLRCL
jgi:hypothetical protein